MSLPHAVCLEHSDPEPASFLAGSFMQEMPIEIVSHPSRCLPSSVTCHPARHRAHAPAAGPGARASLRALGGLRDTETLLFSVSACPKFVKDRPEPRLGLLPTCSQLIRFGSCGDLMHLLGPSWTGHHVRRQALWQRHQRREPGLIRSLGPRGLRKPEAPNRPHQLLRLQVRTPCTQATGQLPGGPPVPSYALPGTRTCFKSGNSVPRGSAASASSSAKVSLSDRAFESTAVHVADSICITFIPGARAVMALKVRCLPSAGWASCCVSFEIKPFRAHYRTRKESSTNSLSCVADQS